MTNLYNFLRRIMIDAQGQPGAVNISAEELQWLQQYLSSPENELHFKSRKVGMQGDMPIMEHDMAMKGEPFEIFALLSEAMLNNALFADQVVMAANFFKDHVPHCENCQNALRQARSGDPSWEFKPHSKD